MRYAADLHLHSHYSAAVSIHMTVETIAVMARLKGIDVIGTGDCLQPDWLVALEASLVPDDNAPGWFRLTEAMDERVQRRLPERCRGPVRFVLSTEVHCETSSAERLRGIHHLIYFPSLASARDFRAKVAPHGDLREGRPALKMESAALLELVLAHDPDCHLAPAHVLNPYFSALGTVERKRTLADVYGTRIGEILAVETGLTSTPAMDRRISALDRHALFSCSDAHSPDNVGRECTILETAPGYAAMCSALRSGDGVRELHKFPLERSRYYRNRCSACAAAFPADHCPQCGKRLVMGSHDRLEQLADRATPIYPANLPLVRTHLPLKMVIADLMNAGLGTKPVKDLHKDLLERMGPERFILDEASEEHFASARVPKQLARAVIDRRWPDFDFSKKRAAAAPIAEQPSLL